MAQPSIKQLQQVFSPFEDRVLAVVVYGSMAKKTMTPRSDIDICIVAPHSDPHQLYKDTLSLPYDIHIFETMPLFLQMQVINHHKIILASDKYDLGEYFYRFRKLWQDQQYRQQLSMSEVRGLFQ